MARCRAAWRSGRRNRSGGRRQRRSGLRRGGPGIGGAVQHAPELALLPDDLVGLHQHLAVADVIALAAAQPAQQASLRLAIGDALVAVDGLLHVGRHRLQPARRTTRSTPATGLPRALLRVVVAVEEVAAGRPRGDEYHADQRDEAESIGHESRPCGFVACEGAAAGQKYHCVSTPKPWTVPSNAGACTPRLMLR